MQKPTANRWYAGQVVGQNTLGKTIKLMLQDSKLDGYFTGHSLRHSGITRLFQAGVDRKIIKEMSGHKSDAVDCYAVTSEEQKQKVSNILGSKPCTVSAIPKICDGSKNETCVSDSIVSNKVGNQTKVNVTCCDSNRSANMNNSGVSQLVSELIDKSCKKGKTVIKIEIEISHD